ncbi:prion-like-(Q/N-rich) domain-bearing protein 25 [Neocloeon triangulifer]|uniref:prion-like-(Q/N-rich) domain-bearing protein 25 n=1 Tax=Neocloeon triangulifer TaxID=2078957 RepID=UPI00286EDAEB|nr:prion-like-(Q/N-rich) domain-bearing protein 25 [Neocloeon triangulifer]
MMDSGKYLICFLCLTCVISPLYAALLGEDCTGDSDCSTVPKSICGNNKKCECIPGFIDNVKGGIKNECFKIADKLGDSCKSNAQCPFENAVCPDGANRVCKCSTNFVENTAKDKCLQSASFINGACEVLNQCAGLIGSTCTSGRCQCPATHILKTDFSGCVPEVKDFVTECVQVNQCTAANMYCDIPSKRCTCSGKHVPVGSSCMKVADKLGDSCSSNTQCPFENAVCSDGATRVCKCSTNFVLNVAKDKCLPTVAHNGKCTEKAQCTTTGEADCVEGICSCNKDFVFAANNNCLAKRSLGEICTDDAQCQLSEKSDRAFCPSYKKCNCKPPFTAVIWGNYCNSGVQNAVSTAILAIALLFVKLV